MIRWFGAVAASLLLVASAAAHAPRALASETWCDTDPPVVIVTPGGNSVVVYVVDSGPLEHLLSLAGPSVSYAVQPVGGGTATEVKLFVTVPNDPLGSGYGVSSAVWSDAKQAGTRYDVESGVAGTAIKLQFRLPVP